MRKIYSKPVIRRGLTLAQVSADPAPKQVKTISGLLFQEQDR